MPFLLGGNDFVRIASKLFLYLYIEQKDFAVFLSPALRLSYFYWKYIYSFGSFEKYYLF